MKKKLILGLVITSLVISNMSGIMASGSFNKYVMRDTSKISTDPRGQKVIKEVRDMLPAYGQVKMDLMAIYFATDLNINATEGFGTDNPADIGFISQDSNAIFINAGRLPYEDIDLHQTGKQILAHEVGHAIDYNQKIDNKDDIEQNFGPSETEYVRDSGEKVKIRSNKFLYSSTKQFLSIWKEENRYMRDLDYLVVGRTDAQKKEAYQKIQSKDPEYILATERYLSSRYSYYEGYPEEFFAESVSYYLLYNDDMKLVAPKTYDYIDRVLNQKYEIVSYANQNQTNYQIDFFIYTKNKEILSQIISKEHDYLTRHEEQANEIVNILGQDAKDYLDSTGDTTYEDYLKQKHGGKIPDTTGSNQDTIGTNKDTTNNNENITDKNEENTGGKNNSVYDGDFSNYYGWVEKDGTWYFIDENGNKAVGWYEDNGQKFLFNENGQMQTGLIETPEGKKVYYDEFGPTNKKTGWVKDKDSWCYLDSDGTSKTGWIQDGGAWYYLNEKGTMATGWTKDKDTWYYLNSNGSMATGWVQDGDKWYYLNPNGSMASNTTVDGYNLGSDGAWIK